MKSKPVTLRFYGGFFHFVYGREQAPAVEVMFRHPIIVEVTGKNDVAQAACSAACRIDFLSKDPLIVPAHPAIRAIANALPLNYGGFTKTVFFRGGEMRSVFDMQVFKQANARFQEDRTNLGDVVAFRKLARLEELPLIEQLTCMSRDFFISYLEDERALAPWLDGYYIEVKMQSVTTRINGSREIGLRITPGTVISFDAHPGSTVPHFPNDNPHVLERPPTGS